MNSKINKILPFTGVLTVLFIIIARRGSYPLNMVILGVMITLFLPITLGGIIFRKRLKSKWMLLGGISVCLCGGLAYFSMYSEHNNINNNNIILILSPIVMFVAIHSGFRFKLDKLTGKKEIKMEKFKANIIKCILVVAEITALYIAFIK
ncbi:hypothetical protein [Clostridium sp.]|uniref:hypothetical protein n=1 Tax=Clostridium sp. TaxID=1506 RepID=UPI0026141EB6|nr:hypothetical protein [uncultured Clostridium sp.]